MQIAEGETAPTGQNKYRAVVNLGSLSSKNSKCRMTRNMHGFEELEEGLSGLVDCIF